MLRLAAIAVIYIAIGCLIAGPFLKFELKREPRQACTIGDYLMAIILWPVAVIWVAQNFSIKEKILDDSSSKKGGNQE